MTRSLQPFFTYYGGKWRVAPKYLPPSHQKIVEPFAGSAGYALRYPDRQVELYDLDPTICGIWDYLIRVPEEEILSLPLKFGHVDELNVPQEAKWLIGFWLNKGVSSPRKQPSAWMVSGIRPNSFWGEAVRLRIAEQVGSIRHWKVLNSPYTEVEDCEATWFIDPPYQGSCGEHYKFHNLDYGELGAWSLVRVSLRPSDRLRAAGGELAALHGILYGEIYVQFPR